MKHRKYQVILMLKKSAFNKSKDPIEIGKLTISKIVTYDKDSYDKIRVK